jgi:hypothetical protein
MMELWEVQPTRSITAENTLLDLQSKIHNKNQYYSTDSELEIAAPNLVGDQIFMTTIQSPISRLEELLEVVNNVQPS